MKKWKIYIVAHNKIHDLTVDCDPHFNNDNYCYLNVGGQDQLINGEKYSVINQRDLENATIIGKYWAESEGLYNLWRSGIYKELDYIGCIHYDFQLKLETKNPFITKTNITDRINKYIEDKDRGHISFSTFTTKFDFGQQIMLDPEYPNQSTGPGRNCYYTILEDYNNYFGTSYTIEDFLNRKKINLCSCFLIDTVGFDKMMGFFEYLYNSHKLDAYDTVHAYRFQGVMAERYFGLFMLFEYENMKDLSLIHMWDAGWK